MMKNAMMTFLAVFAVTVAQADQPRILAYTRNFVTGGKGFVHDNIAANIAALKQLGAENGFEVDTSDDPVVFTDDNLKKYKELVFANSNNEAFSNDEQRDAFKRYIRAGGGFVGIHSASGSERQWPWFWALLGGSFSFHAPMQKFTVNVMDSDNPSTKFFNTNSFAWTDEFYVMKEQPEGLRILLAGNIKKLKMPDDQRKKADAMPDSIPLAWCHTFEGGRSFYTALGHRKTDYSDPDFRGHILGGILWAMGHDK